MVQDRTELYLPRECVTQPPKFDLVDIAEQEGSERHRWHEDAPLEVFRAFFAGMDAHVVGVMLARPLCTSNVMSLLSEAQQVQRRYWLCTKYSSRDILFLEVLRAEPLAAPFVVWSSVGRRGDSAFF